MLVLGACEGSPPPSQPSPSPSVCERFPELRACGGEGYDTATTAPYTPGPESNANKDSNQGSGDTKCADLDVAAAAAHAGSGDLNDARAAANNNDANRAVLVIRSSRQPNAAMLVGQEGSELLKLDLEGPAVSRVAELPRVDLEPDAGYHRLKAHLRGGIILLNWELGILAFDPSFELRWRQDLVWNHRIVHLDDGEIWFDYFYDSEDGSERIGVEPYGFSVATGRQIFDRRPPDGATELA